VIDTLTRDCGLTSSWHIADMGSGTGRLARLFLDFGCAVSGVEPNEEKPVKSFWLEIDLLT
jgi:hypothetical protein